MPVLEQFAPDRMADHFVNYLMDEYKGSRHVRRVASWVGLILMGIQGLPDMRWRPSRTRQLLFEVGGHRFKAKYDHQVGSRGGLVVVEVLPLQGSPEGEAVCEITSLEEANRFYRGAPKLFSKFLRHS